MPENFSLNFSSQTNNVTNSLIAPQENNETKKKTPQINSIFTVPNANEINPSAGAYIS